MSQVLMFLAPFVRVGPLCLVGYFEARTSNFLWLRS